MAAAKASDDNSSSAYADNREDQSKWHKIFVESSKGSLERKKDDHDKYLVHNKQEVRLKESHYVLVLLPRLKITTLQEHCSSMNYDTR
jgi:hypothetical protein